LTRQKVWATALSGRSAVAPPNGLPINACRSEVSGAASPTSCHLGADFDVAMCGCVIGRTSARRPRLCPCPCGQFLAPLQGGVVVPLHDDAEDPDRHGGAPSCPPPAHVHGRIEGRPFHQVPNWILKEFREETRHNQHRDGRQSRCNVLHLALAISHAPEPRLQECVPFMSRFCRSIVGRHG
jgi:hypothetical protein